MIISTVHNLELRLRGAKCFIRRNIAKDNHGPKECRKLDSTPGFPKS